MQLKLSGVVMVALAIGSCGEQPRQLTKRSALTISGPATILPAAPDSVNGNGFGRSVAIEGDTAVIASNGTAGKGVFVFRAAGTGWAQVAKLVPPDDSSPAGWGHEVALSRGRIAISSWTADATEPGGGIYTFVGGGSQWAFEGRIARPQNTNTFGLSIALSGDTLVMMESFRSVLVYVRGQTGWVLQQQLQAPALPPSDSTFGHAIAIDGDRLAISDPSETVNGTLIAGAVYVYDRSAAIWPSPTRLVAPDNLENDNFGTSVALRGDTLIVGAAWNLRGGAATPYRNGKLYIFTKDGDSWSSQKVPGTNQRTGWSLAIDYRRFVSVAASDSDGVTYAGATYIFEKTGGSWSEVGVIKSPFTSASRFYGSSVALSKDRLLIGTDSYTWFGAPIPGYADAFALNVIRQPAGGSCARGDDCQSDLCVSGVCQEIPDGGTAGDGSAGTGTGGSTGGAAGGSAASGAAGTSGGGSGTTGTVGSGGSAGSTGASGSAGAAGIGGMAGSAGAGGSTGAAGTAGTAGAGGTTGAAGASGSTGAAGTAGTAGAGGTTGAAGASGGTGAAGTSGSAGAGGSAGSSWITGAGGSASGGATGSGASGGPGSGASGGVTGSGAGGRALGGATGAAGNADGGTIADAGRDSRGRDGAADAGSRPSDTGCGCEINQSPSALIGLWALGVCLAFHRRRRKS